MTRSAFAVLTLLTLPIVSIGCGDSESDGYREITASIDSLPTTAEVEASDTESAGDAVDPQNDAAAVPVADPATTEPQNAADTATADTTSVNPPGSATNDAATTSPAPDATSSSVASTTEPAAGTPADNGSPPTDPTSQPGTPAATAAAKPKREIKLLIPSKTFRAEGPEEAVRVSFDDVDLLKVLNMDPVIPKAPEMMPDWLKRLDGKRVRIRGFMIPPFAESGIRAFTLARDTQLCCFGRNPLPYDLIDVFLREGAETDYIELRPFAVVGVFHIGEEIEPGYLYSIDDAVVIQ